MTKKAVVLFSGGLDSTTVVAIAAHRGFEINAMTFRYGQRHMVEIDAAKRIVAQGGFARHVVVDLPPELFAGSALTDGGAVPKDVMDADIGSKIPSTYVPARNAVFLTNALAWAEVIGAHDIFLGVNALDYSGYPDCRPEFIAAFERMANLATKAGVEDDRRITVHTPLILMSKSEIVRTGTKLGVDYSLTTSCYDPSDTGAACGHCEACRLRLKGFKEVGMVDPVAYLPDANVSS